MYISLSKIWEPRSYWWKRQSCPSNRPPTPQRSTWSAIAMLSSLCPVPIPSCYSSWSVSVAQEASRFLGNCSSPSP